MKKIIKKSCAVALLAVVGTGAVGSMNFVQNKPVFAEVTSNANITPAIKISGQKNKTASIGANYKLPTASMTGGTLESIKVTHNGKEVAISTLADGKYVSINNIGEYVITYTFDKGGVKHTATTTFYGETVSCSLEDVSSKLPTTVPSSFAGDIVLPMPKLIDKNGEEITGAVVSAVITEPKNYATLSYDANKVIDFTNAKTNNKLHTGNYTIKYVAEIGGIQVAQSTTNYSFNVSDNYEFNVANFKYTFDSTITTWELGKEEELPGVKATHKVDDKTTENVNVSYTVKKVLLQEVGSEEKVDVTSSVINGTKFKPTIAGKYTLTYEVKDYLGNVSTFENNLILTVEDKTKPEIKVVEAYETNATVHTDASYKLASKSLAEDIVVMPIWAEDLGTTNFADFQKLDITIINLSDTNRETVFSTSNKIGDTDQTAPVNKELVFNKTNITINDATQYDTGVNLKAGNKYRITYTATDKAGKSASKEYTLEVVADLTYEAPKLEWVDVIPNEIEVGETLTFSAPNYTDTIEDGDGLYKVVEYSFDGISWTSAELKDSKYEIEIPEDTTATEVKIRATASNNGISISNTEYAISDYRYSHFTGKLEKTISIVNLSDTAVPDIATIGTVAGTLMQGEDITLPSISVTDDMVGNVSIQVDCYHVDGEVETKMTVFDVVSYAVSGVKYLESAKITAARSGDYRVDYRVTDAGNNVVIQSYKFSVAENPDLVEVRFTNLPTEIAEGGKVELGNKVTLTAPIIAMPETSTAVWYVKQLSGPSDAVKGSDNQYYFEPTRVGTYTLQYVGIVTDSTLPTKNITSNVYTVVVEDTTNPEYYISTAIPQQLAKDAEFVIPGFDAYDEKGTGINSEKSYVRLSCPSQTYNAIYLKDLKDKSTTDLTMTLKYQEEYTLTYYIEDNAGNSITKTFKIAVGDTQNPEIIVNDKVLKQGNKVVTNTAQKGTLTVDLSQIAVSDNVSTDLEASDVIITLKNKTLDKIVDSIDTAGEGKYSWNIETAGTYEITFKVKDAAEHYETVTKTFTVDAEDNKGVENNEVLGTVLIVVSVLVLAGVIVYFIVSKKKSDKLYREN